MPWVNRSSGQLKESKHQFASNKWEMQKKKKKGKKMNDRSASWSWRIREVWCWVGETMLQQKCHLSHPWHEALYHCVPWFDSLFVQTSGSIKNDPQLSQRPSTRSKRQTEVKRQTIFQYRCLIFTACSTAGVDGRRTVRHEDKSVSFEIPVEWRLQSPKLVEATSKYHYNLIKLCKTIFSEREEECTLGFFSIRQRFVVGLATSWQLPRCPLTRTRAVIWQSVYSPPQDLLMTIVKETVILYKKRVSKMQKGVSLSDLKVMKTRNDCEIAC